MKFLSTLLLGLLLSLTASAQTGIPVPEMSNCDNLVANFLSQYNIPSATVALAKDGKLVYMRAFGDADLAGQEETQPYHMFRIASVSKPITGIAMMKMIEDGHVSLTDKVFGSNGIFANNSYFNTANVTDNRIFDITVQHLLEHSCGWNRNIACTPSPPSPYTWNVSHCDPIGFPLHVTEVLNESNPVSEQALIRFLMEKGVEFDPGTEYQYSNIGYLTLGLIIEEIMGVSYEQYVQDNILHPLGIYDMHIGKNLLEDKREREGEYVGNGYNAPSIYGTGINVPWEYGGWNLEAMDAHGGWIASARDLVRLLVAVDGFNTKPDILSSASINEMVTPSANNAFYAKGWSVNAANNWWHTGALDGTASIWARTSGGYTWAILLNKRVIDGTANAFWAAFDGLPWNCISQTSNYPAHDLFDFPAQNSSDLTFTPIDGSSLTVSWTPGDGEQRILIAREEEAVTAFPLDGVDYTSNAAFGTGDDLGDGNFVVHASSGNVVILTGLDSTKTYHFRLFDYNQNTTTGNHALYQLANSAIGSASTLGTSSIEDLEEAGIRFYPNPAKDWLRIEVPASKQVDKIEIRNVQGQIVKQIFTEGTNTNISIADLTPQVYAISFFKNGIYVGSGRVMKQ